MNEKKSVWHEWGKSLLIVILIAILIRSFVISLFKIPSSSMVPTLEVGDYLFVVRYSYGLRIPFTHVQFFPASPRRGDVAVFDYPVNPSKDYIKRIIGLPGDEIRYVDNKLYINGKEIPSEHKGKRAYFRADDSVDVAKLYQERLPDVTHEMLRKDFSIKDGVWKVPEGHYFVLGDNRNNSKDSRFWGFVPQSFLVGKAVIIWFSWNSHKGEVRWNRIGSKVK